MKKKRRYDLAYMVNKINIFDENSKEKLRKKLSVNDFHNEEEIVRLVFEIKGFALLLYFLFHSINVHYLVQKIEEDLNEMKKKDQYDLAYSSNNIKIFKYSKEKLREKLKDFPNVEKIVSLVSETKGFTSLLCFYDINFNLFCTY